tara:strand:- start:454 stop:714 length:261 start_codon:yes stop_codon:yes gene_type:complete
MATGSEASSFWNLYNEIEESSGGVYANDLLLADLIRFLPANTINKFVESFRSTREIPSHDLEEPDSETDIIPFRSELANSTKRQQK